MKTIDVAGRRIGPGQPCFVIAEAGINHNGRLDLALKLVDAAVACGADAVKFQTWITEKVLTPGAALAEYQKRNLGSEETQFEMAKRLELGRDDFRKIKAHAEAQGIIFFSTPDEEDSADFLAELGVALFKIGSAEVDNVSFLAHVAGKGKPVILSTGMSTFPEVACAVDAMRETGNQDLALLHCVSEYPAPAAHCNLRAMKTMEQAFDCPIGFSDHTLGTHIAVAAMAAGACLLEKHLTLDRTMSGPDHRASLDPQEFGKLVRELREAESAMGDGVKRPVPSELLVRKVVRKVVVAAEELPIGHVLGPGDLALRRAGDGAAPSEMAAFFGRRVKVKIVKNSPIQSGMLV